MKKIFYTLVLLLVFHLSALAQRSVQSTVFDAKNGMPLEMVTVRLLNVSDSALVQGAQTNTKGYFVLPGDRKSVV